MHSACNRWGPFYQCGGGRGIVVKWFGTNRPSQIFSGLRDLTAVVIMLPTVMLAAPYGVKFANHLSQRKLKKVFAIFMIVVALDMLYDLIAK